MTSAGPPPRSTPPPVLRLALLVGATLMIVAGVGIYLILEEPLVGLVIAAVGVLDLLTVPLVMRSIGRRSGSSPTAAPADGEPEPAGSDPSYNPYARED